MHLNKCLLFSDCLFFRQAELVTYGQLQSLVNRISNTLKSSGVKKGDRVALYIPNTPVAVACMLACARIGAIHTVVFAGFSADALAGRIQVSNHSHFVPN